MAIEPLQLDKIKQIICFIKVRYNSPLQVVNIYKGLLCRIHHKDYNFIVVQPIRNDYIESDAYLTPRENNN